MIETRHITKNFGAIQAVNDISISIQEGSIFGLIGTNGAGKSTFLRILAGILRPDSGDVTIDGHPVFENTAAKNLFFYISDDQYFLPSATPTDMMRFYQAIYPDFSESLFHEYLGRFSLDGKRKIRTFSKGMKKQLSVILGLCARTRYLFCDETFDGLDPVMRQGVKSIFAGELSEREFTPIIASHNLRELEDICDHVGLLHQGGVLLSKDLWDLKCNIHKVQCVFKNPAERPLLSEQLTLLKSEERGSLVTLTIRGKEEEILQSLSKYEMIFMELLPLTLEEIFINETEVVGYDIKNLIY